MSNYKFNFFDILNKLSLILILAFTFFLTFFYSESKHTLSSSEKTKVYQANSILPDPDFDQSLTNYKKPVRPRDPRAIKLERYLNSQKSRLAKQADLIIELSDNYKIDYRLTVGIAGLESGYCKEMFASNNCWGFGSYSWSSLETAVKEYFRLMNKGYFSKGLTTIYDIAPIYNSSNPDEFVTRYYIHHNRIG